MVKGFGMFKTREEIEKENREYEEELRRKKRADEEKKKAIEEAKRKEERERYMKEVEDSKNELYKLVKEFKEGDKNNFIHIQFKDNSEYYIPYNNITIKDTKVVLVHVENKIRHGVTLDFIDNIKHEKDIYISQIKAIEIIENESYYNIIEINGIKYTPISEGNAEYKIDNKEILNTNISYLKYPCIIEYIIS